MSILTTYAPSRGVSYWVSPLITLTTAVAMTVATVIQLKGLEPQAFVSILPALRPFAFIARLLGSRLLKGVSYRIPFTNNTRARRVSGFVVGACQILARFVPFTEVRCRDIVLYQPLVRWNTAKVVAYLVHLPARTLEAFQLSPYSLTMFTCIVFPVIQAVTAISSIDYTPMVLMLALKVLEGGRARNHRCRALVLYQPLWRSFVNKVIFIEAASAISESLVWFTQGVERPLAMVCKAVLRSSVESTGFTTDFFVSIAMRSLRSTMTRCRSIVLYRRASLELTIQRITEVKCRELVLYQPPAASLWFIVWDLAIIFGVTTIGFVGYMVERPLPHLVAIVVSAGQVTISIVNLCLEVATSEISLRLAKAVEYPRWALVSYKSSPGPSTYVIPNEIAILAKAITIQLIMAVERPLIVLKTPLALLGLHSSTRLDLGRKYMQNWGAVLDAMLVVDVPIVYGPQKPSKSSSSTPPATRYTLESTTTAASPLITLALLAPAPVESIAEPTAVEPILPVVDVSTTSSAKFTPKGKGKKRNLRFGCSTPTESDKPRKIKAHSWFSPPRPNASLSIRPPPPGFDDEEEVRALLLTAQSPSPPPRKRSLRADRSSTPTSAMATRMLKIDAPVFHPRPTVMSNVANPLPPMAKVPARISRPNAEEAREDKGKKENDLRSAAKIWKTRGRQEFVPSDLKTKMPVGEVDLKETGSIPPSGATSVTSRLKAPTRTFVPGLGLRDLNAPPPRHSTNSAPMLTPVAGATNATSTVPPKIFVPGIGFLDLWVAPSPQPASLPIPAHAPVPPQSKLKSPHPRLSPTKLDVRSLFRGPSSPAPSSSSSSPSQSPEGLLYSTSPPSRPYYDPASPCGQLDPSGCPPAYEVIWESK